MHVQMTHWIPSAPILKVYLGTLLEVTLVHALFVVFTSNQRGLMVLLTRGSSIKIWGQRHTTTQQEYLACLPLQGYWIWTSKLEPFPLPRKDSLNLVLAKSQWRKDMKLIVWIMSHGQSHYDVVKVSGILADARILLMKRFERLWDNHLLTSFTLTSPGLELCD